MFRRVEFESAEIGVARRVCVQWRARAAERLQNVKCRVHSLDCTHMAPIGAMLKTLVTLITGMQCKCEQKRMAHR